MIPPRRFATMAAALCGTVVVAGWVVIGVAGFGLPGSKNTDAAPIEDHRAPPLSVDAKPVDALQATAMAKAGVSNADAVTAPTAVTGAGGSGEAEAIVEAALPDLSQMLAPETPPVQIAMVSTPDMLAPETSNAQIAMVSTPDPVHTDAKVT